MNKDIGDTAIYMMYVRDQLKIYHWSTIVYARHVASDSFVNSLSEKMDKFIETLQGNSGKRIGLSPSSSIQLRNETDKTIIDVLTDFRRYLVQDLGKMCKNHTDLLNIRDEILGDVNKTLYLFSLS
jgi:hypothetical protein